MEYHQYSTSTERLGKQQQQQQRLTPWKCILENITNYETAKMVRFEAKCIGFLSLVVKLSLAVGCSYLMFQRNSYQIFDRSPISAVIIKVKQAPNCSSNSSLIYQLLNYTCEKSLYDVTDFISPPAENSAVSVTTRLVQFEHILKSCDNTTIEKNVKSSSLSFSSMHKCYDEFRCILPPFYRYDDDYEVVLSKHKLCWFKLPETPDRFNYQALDYIVFIKHFIEFPQLGLIRDNLLSDHFSEAYIKKCEYDPNTNPLCPKFRILKILQMVETNPRKYESMLFHGSLIEIKISWKCDLDRSLKYCEPLYEFRRLDVIPYDDNPYVPGSNFLISRHFFRPNDRKLHRIHSHIYNLHIIVSVTGEVGRFDLFQTTTSIGSFLGIFGTGSIVCDLIAAFITNFKRVKYDN